MPARLSAEDKLALLELVDAALAAGWTRQRACDLLEVDVRRVRRWAALRAAVHRLAYQQSAGQLSADADRGAGRPRRADQLAWIGRHDVPDEPEAAEPGRDLPVEIMRQLCAQLDFSLRPGPWG